MTFVTLRLHKYSPKLPPVLLWFPSQDLILKFIWNVFLKKNEMVPAIWLQSQSFLSWKLQLYPVVWCHEDNKIWDQIPRWAPLTVQGLENRSTFWEVSKEISGKRTQGKRVVKTVLMSKVLEEAVWQKGSMVVKSQKSSQAERAD